MSDHTKPKEGGTESRNTQQSGLDAIERNREAIEAIAATDLPVAPYAQLLLDKADEEGGR